MQSYLLIIKFYGKRKKTYTGHFTFFLLFYILNLISWTLFVKNFNRAKNEAQLKCMMKGNW